MTSAKLPKLPAVFLPNGGRFEPWHCHRCGNPVRLENAVVLEENSRTTEIHDLGMPEDESDGLLLFGKDCASQLRKRARHVHSGPIQNTKHVQQVMLERLEGKHKTTNGAYAECLREVLKVSLKH